MNLATLHRIPTCTFLNWKPLNINFWCHIPCPIWRSFNCHLLDFSGWESNCQFTFNNFIPHHSFDHNVNFKSPNLENTNSLSIFVLKTLPIILRKCIFSLFFIFIFLPNIWGHHKTPIPIVEKQLMVQAFQ